MSAMNATRCVARRRHAHAHHAAVERRARCRRRSCVDRSHDLARRSRNRVAFSSSLTWCRAWFERRRHARSTVAPSGMRPALRWLICTLRAGRRGAGAADEQVALRHRIDLAVGALAAASRSACRRAGSSRCRSTRRSTSIVWPGCANGGSCAVTITAATFFSCMLGAGRHGDAHLLQHRQHRLHRERRLRGLVAGAVEADDEAVAEQLVLAHAADAGDFLEALGMGRSWPAAGRAARRRIAARESSGRV